jgi:hypothetical protein
MCVNGVMMGSEIIDDSVFDFAHELSAPLDFLTVHLLLLLLLRLQLSLVDSVLLENDGLHLRSLQFLFCCLSPSLLLFLTPYLFPLLHQSPLPLFLRLHFRLLDCCLSLLFYRGRLHSRLNFGLHSRLNFGLNMLHLRRFLHFLTATHWRQNHRLLTH